MKAQQLNMDVISNNLANANTTGFKCSRANFGDLMYQLIVPPGAETANDANVPTGIQVGMGVKTMSASKLFTQGGFTETGNQLDLAIEGEGFFKVMRGDEELYTRAGTFKLDEEGYLCDPEGARLQPEVTVPQEAVAINIDPGGSVTALDQNGAVIATGEILLYDFANPAGLMSMGRNCFVPTEASGEAVEGEPGVEGIGSILQGFLESSNINVVEEMVNMMSASRSYEANVTAVKTTKDMAMTALEIGRS